MGKIKNELIGNTSRHELEDVLQKQYEDDAYNYQQWLESDEYLNFINDQLEYNNPIYSKEDITQALNWAKSAVNIDPTDIGKDVYDILFIEKVEEHLNKISYDRF